MTGKTKRSKLGVDIEAKLKKRLDHESVDTGLSLRKLVDLRLRESYKSHPSPIRTPSEAPQAASA